MDVDGSPYRVVVHTVDRWRIYFNNNFDHLEPWQLVMYTISWILFIQWVRKIVKYEEGFTLKQTWNSILLNVPYIRKKQEINKDLLSKKLEENMLKYDVRKEFYKFLPDRGLMTSDIVGEAADYRTMSDLLFKHGRMSGSSFDDNEEHTSVLTEVFRMYCFSNSAFPDIFPAIRKMEAEVVRMLCSLYHGGPRSCGAFTTSGAESIFLTCCAYRNRAYKCGIRKPEIIIAENANVNFCEAAHLLGLRIVKLPMNRHYEADIGAIKRAICRETCLIVVSAPSPVTGTLDPIEDISQLGLRYGVPVHVDANWGGFILPFMEQCDFKATPFDFRVSGVSSLTVDLDKYAYCPSGASAVLYRDSELLEYQCFSETTWSGGVYVTPTLSESRPGSLIALTWATLLFHGRHGYVEKTQQVLDTAQLMVEKLKTDCDEQIQVIGEPIGPIICFTTTAQSHIPPHFLANEMCELGWNLGPLQHPEALRMCITMKQTKDDVVSDFIGDLRRCLKKFETTSKETSAMCERSMAVYGLSSSLPDMGLAEVLPKLFLETYYSTPSAYHRSTRTLSIEGRKISQLQSASRLASFSVPNHTIPPSVEE